ncbi:MAG: glycosyltransferase [Methanospirillum sp.]|nr:glycosyltransferase [Methanospirillum sp.]
MTIRSRDDYLLYLEADRAALDASTGRSDPRGEGARRFLRLLRAVEYHENCRRAWYHRPARSLLFIRLHRASLRLGFTIPPNVFGPGLLLPHRGTIVVNSAARVGANCRLDTCVNIGTRAGEDAEAPIIGENVSIGQGTVMYGRITIADDITIHPKSVVNRSFLEPRIEIAGSPARPASPVSPAGATTPGEGPDDLPASGARSALPAPGAGTPGPAPPGTGAPAVSVVLPTYNRAAILPRAIESVLFQTWTDFELIVVDDGSTDETPSVMASVTDPRVRYVRYAPNRGANHARNVGIREARAGYIAFQDSDDDWYPEKLEKSMAAFAAAGREVGVVYSGYWQDLAPPGKRVYVPLPWVRRHDGWIHEELLRNNFVATPTAVVRRDCFETSGPWLEGLPGKQEWELFLRISRDYQFRFIAEPLLDCRFSEGGISDNSHCILRATEQILDLHHDDFAGHPEVLAEHCVRLGLQYVRAGEFEKGRDYLCRGAKLQPRNPKYRAAALASRLGEGAFNRLVGWYLRDSSPVDRATS